MATFFFSFKLRGKKKWKRSLVSIEVEQKEKKDRIGRTDRNLENQERQLKNKERPFIEEIKG